MRIHHVFDIDLSGYSFEELPKGYVAKVSINPYTGYVFLDFEKHETSTTFALDIMRRVVSACDVLEGCGSDDPLRDYSRLCEAGMIDWVLADAARERIKAFEGGKDRETQVSASVQGLEKVI